MTRLCHNNKGKKKMKKYEIALYENFHTIDTEEKFYKYLLKCYIDKYKVHFIKSIRICKKFK